jgi:hypothetical protein
MENVGLVGCKAPDEKMDRYYQTTGSGKKFVGITETKEKYFFPELPY